jgi:large subunit ribosomal protein L23
MNIKPVFSEKSMNEAKKGKYTFWVGRGLTKKDIKKLINTAFGVTVRTVKTINLRKEQKTTLNRKKVTVPARKKAIVTLSKDEKINIFGEGAKK